MSSGGYHSFAECMINRWTSRSALILGNGRNVESTVGTHTHSTSLSSCCCCSRDVCVDIYCSVYPLFGCFCVCMYMSLSRHDCMSVFCTWGHAVDLCGGMCVVQRCCLCGPAMWQKNSPLTFSLLYWFTWSDLITSKCTTVSTVHSVARRRRDDTVCAVMLEFTKIKDCFTSFNPKQCNTIVTWDPSRKLSGLTTQWSFTGKTLQRKWWVSKQQSRVVCFEFWVTSRNFDGL